MRKDELGGDFKKILKVTSKKVFISDVWLLEAANGGTLQNKVFLEISQNSQQNTCARVSFLIKLQGSGLQLY